MSSSPADGPTTTPGPSAPARWPPTLVLGLVVALGLAAALRLWGLGAADLRSDEIGLLSRLLQQPSLGDLLADHLRQFGQYRQLPLSRVAAWAASWPWRPDLGPEHLRLAFALAGVATVAAMAWFGWELGGLAPACVLALLTALNPFHLFWSRTAHVYVFPILCLALVYAASARLTTRLLHHGRARPALWLVATAASVAAGLSFVGAWLAVAMAWGVVVVAWSSRGGAFRCRWAVVLAGPLVWAASLLPWLLALPAGVAGELGVGSGLASLGALGRLPLAFGFGGGWRLLLSLGLPALALASGHTRGLARLLLGSAAALAAALAASIAPVATPTLRDFVAVWPLWLALVGLGAVAVGRELADRRGGAGRRAALAAALGIGVLVLASARPLQALLDLRGSPVEYSRIAETLDALVAAGTPALVNGRSVVEFEMRPYRPLRAVPTYTVPDAGFAEWRRNRWRESAEDFLRRFPDAPLVQQGRNYYAEAGPWAFPERYFANRRVLVNRPAQLLAGLGLAADEELGGGRSVTEISFNRPQDLVHAATAAGRRTLALWGEGWGYEKTGDLRDWRLLRERAEVELHNLTVAPLTAVLLLEVEAVAGRKRLWLEGAIVEVPPAEEVQTLRIRRRLEPGAQILVLEDRLYQVGRVPLRAASLAVEVEGEAGRESSEVGPAGRRGSAGRRDDG